MGYGIEARPGPDARQPADLRAALVGAGVDLAPGDAPLVLELSYSADEAAVLDSLRKLAKEAGALGFSLHDPQADRAVDPGALEEVVARYRTYRSLAGDVRADALQLGMGAGTNPGIGSFVLKGFLYLALFLALVLAAGFFTCKKMIDDDARMHPGEYQGE